MFVLLTACGSDPVVQRSDIAALYPETSLKGWELNKSNTGLCEDYTGLAILDPATVGAVEYGTLYIRTDGVTISNKQINYPVINEADNVTIDHCLIRPTSCGRGVPVVQVDGATITNSEIDCSLIPLENVNIALNGVDCIIENNYIHGASTGISIHNRSTSRVSVAQGNYIDGLRFYEDPVTHEVSHIDGLTIRVSSGAGIIVRNNSIWVETEIVTGPLFIQAWAGHINNVLIEGNLLHGYGHCLALDYNAHGYGDNMRAVNNRMEALTVQGAGPWYAAVAGGGGWYEWEDNYDYDDTAEDCMGTVIGNPVPYTP